MKLILVIALGLLAVSVYAENLIDGGPVPNGKIFDEIRDIVENGVGYGNEILDKILSSKNDILEKAINSTDLILRDTMNKISDAIAKIKDSSNIGNAGKICFEQYSQQFEDVKNKVSDDIEDCQRIVRTDLKPLERELWQTYMQMHQHISEIYQVIDNCKDENENNKIGYKLCVAKQVKFFKDKITILYEIIKPSIERMDEYVPAALEKFGKCVLKAEMNGIKQLQELAFSVAKCVKENV